MKKFVLYLLISICFSEYGFSQIGIKGGLNFSSLRSDADKSSTSVGFNAGAFYYFKLSDKFYIQPQLLFSYDPNKVTFNNFTDINGAIRQTEFKTNGSFLTLPVLLSYKYPVSNGNKISFDLGGYLSCGLFGKEKIKMFSNSQNEIISSDLFPDRRSRVDIGLMGGVGYEYKKYILSVHLRYGLNTVNQFEDKVIITMLSIGYFL